tara:strand:- start:566 stop:1255 length:690 start_codon:yes stop_codon:yes gene_type:complete
VPQLDLVNSQALTAVSLSNGLLAILLSTFFGYLITLTYRYATNSTSGGRQVASTLLPLTITVCVIISVVKSSLALSLGLVGALSIVRFRTPVKDPEDLVYIFLSIVAGLGFGANQIYFTSISVSVISLLMVARSNRRGGLMKKFDQTTDINIMISWPSDACLEVNSIITQITDFCTRISLLRFNTSGKTNMLFLQANLGGSQSINSIVSALKLLHKDISLSINNSNIDW